MKCNQPRERSCRPCIKSRTTSGGWRRCIGKKAPTRHFWSSSEHSDKPVSGEPIKLDQIGIHHYAFWVENLPQVYEELKAKGADFVVPPTVTKTTDGNFNSAFLRDPDGILVQLDELVAG